MGIFSKQSTTERVNQLLAEERTRDAIELCRDACRGTRGAASDWELYGCVSAGAGDLDTARMALQKAVGLEPGLGTAQSALGKLLATTGEYAEALEHLQQAAQLQSDDAEIWRALGITCGMANQLSEAEMYCRRSLELEPGSAEAHFNLANALQGQGRPSEAEAEYEAALKIDPDMVGGWFMLAKTRVALQNLPDAEAAARRALKLNSQMGEVHYLLGTIASSRGNNNVARDYFRKAVVLLPKLPEAHLRLGELLFGLNEDAGAAESFQRTLDIDPKNSGAHFGLGQCYEKRKLGEQAESCYRKAIALNPDHLQAHYCIAFLYSHRGRHTDAARHFAEVLRLNPRDEQARHLLAAQRGETTDSAPAAYVATLFDGIADTFDHKLVDELGYRIPGVVHELVNQLVTPAAGSMEVIDLGCGTGLCGPLFRGMARTLHGVDLAPRMIEKARERGPYDSLEVNDVVASLTATKSAAWDLAIACDVFVYIGDLHEVFAACGAALRPGGWFAFSVEAGDDAEAFILRDTGRYAHAGAYIRRLAAATGFSEVGHQAVVVRKDKGLVDVDGYVFLLRRGTDAPSAAG